MVDKMDKDHTESWLKIFKDRGYDIGQYNDGFAKYMGMGHRLFVFAEKYNEEKLREIMSLRINPKLMVEPIKNVADKVRMIQVDCEFCAICVIN
jgi:hypothetical protein